MFGGFIDWRRVPKCSDSSPTVLLKAIAPAATDILWVCGLTPGAIFLVFAQRTESGRSLRGRIGRARSAEAGIEAFDSRWIVFASEACQPLLKFDHIVNTVTTGSFPSA